FGRAPETNNIGNVFGAAPPVPFLMPPDEVGLKARAPPDVQESDSLRGMEFMPGQRQEIYAEILNVNFQFAGRLDRVRVAEHSPAAAEGGDFFDGENDAGLIVGPHDRD